MPALPRALAPLGADRSAVAVLGLAVLGLLAVQILATPFTDDPTIDSHSYYFAAEALASGQNPYDTGVLNALAPESLGFVFPYLYPPVVAMLWRPLLRLGPTDAHHVLLGINLLLVFVNVGLLWKLVRPRAVSHATGWLVLLLAFHAVCGPLVSSLRLGQLNVLIMTLVLGALLFEERGEPVLAGVLLGLAILFKLTPFVYVIDLVIRRSWRTLASTALVVGAVTGASILWIGIGPWGAFLDRALRPLPFDPPMSLRGLVDGVGVSMGASPVVLVGVYLGLLTLVLAGVLLRLWRAAAAREGPINGWSILTLFSLVAFPLTWHHHYVLALLPFAYFTIRAFENGRTARGWILVALSLATLLRYPGVLHPMKPAAAVLGIFLG